MLETEGFLQLVPATVAGGPTRGQPGAIEPRMWAGLPNTDLGPVLAEFSLDAAAPSTELLPLQIHATLDSTILPLYMPGAGLEAAGGGLNTSRTAVLPLISGAVREAWRYVWTFPLPSGCLDGTLAAPFWLFWWN